MIRKIYGVLLLMSSLLLMGCPSDSGGDAKDDVVVSSEQIMVSPTTLDFSSAAGVQEHVTVTANCKWMITNIPNWLIVNPKEGSGNATITIETASQNTGNERAVQLKISGLERNVTMTVRQRGEGSTEPTPTEEHSLTVDRTSLSFDATATQQTFNVTSTDAWTVSSNQTWCTVTPASGSSYDHSVKVSVTANTGTTARTATVTVKNGYTADRIVTVTQAASTGSAPVITAFSVGNPTSSSFQFSMTFTSNPASTNYGVCYSSTNSTPTLSDYYTYWSGSSTGGTYNGTVDHNVLVAGTRYYVRAYVQNSYGTTYSSNTLTVTLEAANPNTPNAGDNPTPNVPSRSVNK